MMNPEMMKMAQEMMSKMSPEQLAAMQQQATSMMQNNPGLAQQAMQMAQGMSPEDVRRAQQMAQGMRPEDLVSQGANFSAGLSAQQKLQQDASLQLKNEGNALHGQRRFKEAAEKYSRALGNLEGHSSQAAKELRTSCRGNLASCYLQLGQHTECVEQCDAVLATDAGNRKALYRRGQAYAALGRGAEAVRDLQQALALSPESEKESIREKLKEAQEKERLARRGVVIEEVTEDADPEQPAQQQPEPQPAASVPAAAAAEQKPATGAAEGAQQGEVDGLIEEVAEEPPQRPSTANAGAIDLDAPAAAASRSSGSARRVQQPAAAAAGAAPFGAGTLPPGMDPQQMQQMAEMMKANPGMLQMAAQQMQNMSDDQIRAALAQGGAAAAGMSPEMVRMAANSLRGMSPDQLREMADNAIHATGGGGSGVAAAPAGAGAAAPMFTPEMAAAAASSDPTEQMRAASAAIKQNPQMLKDMARMMETMPPEQLEAMAANMPGAMPGMKVDAAQMRHVARMMESMSPEDLDRMAEMARGMAAPQAGGEAGEAGGAAGLPPGFDPSNPGAAMMGDMRRKLADPATMRMMRNMLKGMDPDELAAMMSQATGKDVTPAQARQITESLGNMSDWQMEALAKVTQFVNMLIDLFSVVKKFLLGQGMLMAALLVLLLALLLRWLGWV